MDESVIERSEDVGNAKHKFTLCDLGTERNRILFLGRLHFFGGLNQGTSSSQFHDPTVQDCFESGKLERW
jgi:hypothetical protein